MSSRWTPNLRMPWKRPNSKSNRPPARKSSPSNRPAPRRLRLMQVCHLSPVPYMSLEYLPDICFLVYILCNHVPGTYTLDVVMSHVISPNPKPLFLKDPQPPWQLRMNAIIMQVPKRRKMSTPRSSMWSRTNPIPNSSLGNWRTLSKVSFL